MSNDITTTTHSLLPVKLPPVAPARILADVGEFGSWELRLASIIQGYHGALAFRTLMERKPAKPGEYPNLPSHGELLEIFREAEYTVRKIQHSIRTTIPMCITRLVEYQEQYPEECVKDEQHERKLRQQREFAEKEKKTKEARKELQDALDRYEGLKRWGEESMDEYKTNLRWIDVRDEKIVVINEVLKKHRQKIAAVVNKYREAGIDLD